MVDAETPSAPGRVVLIMGPSSVGKTAVAEALQRSLPGVWLIAGVDLFWGSVREASLPTGAFRSDTEVMRRMTRGWHRAVAAMAAEGNDVIVDELWIHAWWLRDWRKVLQGMPWWSILLRADPATLRTRELERGDRPPGLAARDATLSPGEGGFDLVIDTDKATITDCVSAIRDLIR